MKVNFYVYCTSGFFLNDEEAFDSYILAEEYAKSYKYFGELIIIPKIIEE